MSSASSPLAARSDGSGQTGAKRDLRIGMVAGEPSGDLLAARIIQGLRQGNPGVQVEGIGGPEMAAQQFHQYYPMDALTVFGYVEALKRIPGLVSTYLGMRNQWLRQRPDVFVGIDAPDFNLRLEHRLRQAGVPTVRIDANFKSPCRLGEKLEFSLQIKRIGRSSVNFWLVCACLQDARMTADLTLVWVTPDGRSAPWPQAIRDPMTAFMNGTAE